MIEETVIDDQRAGGTVSISLPENTVAEGGALTSTICVRGLGRRACGSQSGCAIWTPISATSTAAIAAIAVARPRQRWAARSASLTTFALSTVDGAASLACSGTGGAGSGSTIGACGSDNPAALLIRPQTSGRGSTEPTIWFNTPSLYSQARTMLVKSLSADIMVSTWPRSSASRVPSAYSAASAIWSSVY